MVELEPKQSDELIGSTEDGTYLWLNRPTAPSKEWPFGIGAYYELVHRVQRMEDSMRGMAPMLRHIAKEMERNELKDSIPAAASVEYEWRNAVLRTIETVTSMLNTFDELVTRLSCYVKLIEHLKELLKLARGMGNRYLIGSVLTLHDALCGTYSEELTSKQAEAIEGVLNQLYDLNLTHEQVRALDRQLRKSGLETVPSDKFVGLHREQSRK